MGQKLPRSLGADVSALPPKTAATIADRVAAKGQKRHFAPPKSSEPFADCQIAGPARFTRFLAKATITQQAVTRRGTIGEFAKPSKLKARCRWRRKLGAADSGERAGRGRC